MSDPVQIVECQIGGTIRIGTLKVRKTTTPRVVFRFLGSDCAPADVSALTLLLRAYDKGAPIWPQKVGVATGTPGEIAVDFTLEETGPYAGGYFACEIDLTTLDGKTPYGFLAELHVEGTKVSDGPIPPTPTLYETVEHARATYITLSQVETLTADAQTAAISASGDATAAAASEQAAAASEGAAAGSARAAEASATTASDARTAAESARDAAAGSASAAASSASTATTQAGLANDHRSAAEAANAAAQLAKDAANATGKVYPDTATGIAAVADGAYFNVPSSDEADSLILYRRSGAAAVEVKRYPSAAAIHSAADSGSKAAHIFADSNDNALAIIEPDGALLLAGLDRSVQAAAEYAPEAATPAEFAHVFHDNAGKPLAGISADGGLHVPRIGEIQGGTVAPEVITAFEYDSLGVTAKRNAFLDVAKHKYRKPLKIVAPIIGYSEDPGTSMCRQPWVLPLTRTTGLYFCGQQVSNHTGGSENGQRLVVRDYTIDFDAGSVAVSATRIIESPPLIAEGKGQLTDPKAIVIPSGPHAGRIVLVFHRDEHASQLTTDAARFYRQWVTYSDDNGQTWAASALTVNSVDRFASAGQIVRIPSGANAGRLVVPIWRPSSYVGAIFSDDDGATWEMGTWAEISAYPGHPYSEPSLAFRKQGDLVMYVRSDKVTGYVGKGMLTSSDGGATWSYERENTQLAFGNCNMALVSTNPDLDPALGFHRLMASSTASTAYYERTNRRLLVSYDDGETWPLAWAPFPERQGVGYSCLQQIDADTYLLGYETFNGAPGDINKENSVQLLAFNLAEVMSNVSYPSF